MLYTSVLSLEILCNVLHSCFGEIPLYWTVGLLHYGILTIYGINMYDL